MTAAGELQPGFAQCYCFICTHHFCFVCSFVHFSLASVSASQWNSRFSIGGGGTSVTGGVYDDDADATGCVCNSL